MYNTRAKCCKYLLYIIYFTASLKSCISNRNPTATQLDAIKRGTNNTVDPCEDFYEYACGKWPELHPDHNYDEVTGLLEYKTNKRLIDIIEQPSYKALQTFEQKTSSYYEACKAEITHNITRYFDNIKPGPALEWPLLEAIQAQRRNDHTYEIKQWIAEQWNLFSLLGTLQSYGFNNVLINHQMSRNENDSLRIELIVPYELPGDDDDEWPPQMLEAFLIRWGLPTQTAAVYAKNITAVQNNLHVLYRNFSYETDKLKRIELNYKELQQTYPQLYTYLAKILPDNQRSDSDIVILENLDYFEFLLSHQWAPAQVTNYLMLKFLIHLLKDATQGFTALDCMQELRKKMDLAVNYLYYDKIYRNKARNYDADVQVFENNLKTYFTLSLEENHLKLSSSLVQQLQSKIQALTINVGNLPRGRSYYDIHRFYSDVPALDKSNYYSNHLHLLHHRFLKSLLNVQQQSFFVATDNLVGSLTAPFYSLRQNMVILPFGFLQPPVYHHSYHPLLASSLLVFILAHEFTHALDTTGLYHGNDGQMLPTEPEIFENPQFEAALACMQDQQSTTEIDERLSDLVGSQIAYNAYVKLRYLTWQQFASDNWKKLFWRNMAQFFCGRKDISFVAHDADKVRLQEIVKNSKGFAEAFQCPVASPMNPKAKCRLY